MSNIKNRVSVTNLTLLMLLGVMTPINAQTPIALQESRLDSLNDLSYQIKVSKSKVELSKSKVELSKSKVELAKLKKQCLENNGCDTDNNNHLGAISNAVKPISTRLEHNNTEAVINKTPMPIQTNLIKKLNALSISAIINNQVIFKDIEGTFQQGDMLGDSGIKLISITQSGVVLGTANNPNNLNKTKTLTMDWIND